MRREGTRCASTGAPVFLLVVSATASAGLTSRAPEPHWRREVALESGLHEPKACVDGGREVGDGGHEQRRRRRRGLPSARLCDGPMRPPLRRQRLTSSSTAFCMPLHEFGGIGTAASLGRHRRRGRGAVFGGLRYRGPGVRSLQTCYNSSGSSSSSGSGSGSGSSSGPTSGSTNDDTVPDRSSRRSVERRPDAPAERVSGERPTALEQAGLPYSALCPALLVEGGGSVASAPQLVPPQETPPLSAAPLSAEVAADAVGANLAAVATRSSGKRSIRTRPSDSSNDGGKVRYGSTSAITGVRDEVEAAGRGSGDRAQEEHETGLARKAPASVKRAARDLPSHEEHEGGDSSLGVEAAQTTAESAAAAAAAATTRKVAGSRDIDSRGAPDGTVATSPTTSSTGDGGPVSPFDAPRQGGTVAVVADAMTPGAARSEDIDATAAATGARGGGSGNGGGRRKRARDGVSGSGGKQGATNTGTKPASLKATLADAIKKGRGGAALRALRLMLSERQSVSERQYVGVMDACMRQGSWTSGLEAFRLLLEDLRPRGLSPSQGTWRALARGLRAVGQADQGLTVLRQALTGGVEGIDEQVCSILLDLCAIKGRMGLAEEISSLMDAHGISKGPVTYCVLLKGYGRQRRIRGVEQVMRDMRSRGVVPDVVALNAAVDAFVRCGQLPKAMRLLSAMETFPGGSIAQTLTYNTIIKGLGRELRLDEAFEVARNMVDRGCSPNEVTTNSLVDICVRSGDLDRAYNLLKSPDLALHPTPGPIAPGDCTLSAETTSITQEAERAPPQGEGAGMVAELGGAGTGDAKDAADDDDDDDEDDEDVDEVLLMLSPEGAAIAAGSGQRAPEPGAPTATRYSAGSSTGSLPAGPAAPPVATEVPGGTGSKGASLAAGNSGCADTASLSGPGVGSKSAETPPLDDVSGIYLGRNDDREDMSGAAPAEIGAAREGSAAAGDGGDVGAVEGDAGARPAPDSWGGALVRPSVEAFTAVLTGFAGVGDKDRALGVFQQMVTAGVEPNVVTYTALISACVNSGDMDGARRLFRALEARGAMSPAMQPSVVTYNTIIGGLCRMEAVTEPGPNSRDQASGSSDPYPVTSGRQPAGRAGVSSVRAGGLEVSLDQAAAEKKDESAQAAGLMLSPGGGGSGSAERDAKGALPQGIQEALQMLLSMRRRGVPADEITMNSLLDGLVSCNPPRVREAETVLSLMTGWGLRPNQVSYTVMLKGYGRVGDLGSAELMYEVMLNDWDHRPDVVALNSLLDALVRNSDLRRAVQVLEQSIANSLAGRSTIVSHDAWATSSSNRRPWGASASAGAAALFAAATSPPRSPPPVGGGNPSGRGAGLGRSPGGIRVDVGPNQVSFATVVLGLSRRGDANAGRKAIALYERMRRSFGFVPDEGMVDGLMAACWNAQVGQTDDVETALAQGKEALDELRDMGWDERVIASKEQMLMRVVPTLSEIWKEDDGALAQGRSAAGKGSASGPRTGRSSRGPGKDTGAGRQRKRKVSAEIFEKYGWNRMDSHFPVL